MNCFLITTYNRPRSCRKLVLELSKHGDVYLVDDGSDMDYNIESSRYPVYYFRQEHLGKKFYAETVNNLFSMPKKKYDYYFMVPDDFMPVEGFVKKAIKTWKKIEDMRKICLTTYISKAREGKACWTKFEPVQYRDYWLTQWTDMCFMCEQRFFTTLGKIPYSRLNWDKRPRLGSGVGASISSFMYRNGWNICQVRNSLFTPQPEAHHSKMNPWRVINDPINQPVL